jgi:outer membrane protein
MNARYFHIVLLVAVALFISQNALAAPKTNIAVVNISKIFDEYAKTQEVDKEFQSEGRIKQEERDGIVHEIRRLRDEQSLLSDDQRSGKQDEIEEKLKELDSFDLEVKRMIERKRNSAIRDVFKDIESTLQQYGERKGYEMILNDRAVLYRGGSFDITKDVVQELNNEYKKQQKN